MASLRKAVNAKCKDCIYDPEDKGSWRYQVSMCTVTVCPLYDLRPKPGVVVTKDQDVTIGIGC